MHVNHGLRREGDSPQRPQSTLRGMSGGEENLTQRHKGTKFREDRTKVQRSGDQRIPFFRALALSLALYRREKKRI